MGYAKRQLEEQAARGYEPTDGFVCPRCVTDEYLAGVLKNAAQPSRCSYCNRRGAAPVSVLFDALSEAIHYHYNDPAGELPYDGREGGYQGQWWDGYDLFQEEVCDWTDDSSLLDDASTAFANGAWCRRDFFALTPYEALSHGWKEFAHQVKYQTRYLFFAPTPQNSRVDVDGIAPGDMLQALGRLFRDLGLFRTLPSGQELIRARVVDKGFRLTSPADLGPPPAHLATVSNRMSPAGIPMFYGAFESKTAIAETFDPTLGADRRIAVARFRTLQNIEVLDLTRLPDIPSFFDPSGWTQRDPVGFLHSFVEDLTKPIQRDGRVHIEYVPTQVVTEFVRHRLRTPSDESVHGVVYRSSRTTRDAIVLFADATQCAPIPSRQSWEPQTLLSLVRVRHVQPPKTVALRIR